MLAQWFGHIPEASDKTQPKVCLHQQSIQDFWLNSAVTPCSCPCSSSMCPHSRARHQHCFLACLLWNAQTPAHTRFPLDLQLCLSSQMVDALTTVLISRLFHLTVKHILPAGCPLPPYAARTASLNPLLPVSGAQEFVMSILPPTQSWQCQGRGNSASFLLILNVIFYQPIAAVYTSNAKFKAKDSLFIQVLGANCFFLPLAFFLRARDVCGDVQHVGFCHRLPLVELELLLSCLP